jgi:hypothetical protein
MGKANSARLRGGWFTGKKRTLGKLVNGNVSNLSSSTSASNTKFFDSFDDLHVSLALGLTEAQVVVGGQIQTIFCLASVPVPKKLHKTKIKHS